MRTQAEYIGEIFLHTAKLQTEEEKVNYLKSVRCLPLLKILEFAYNDKYTTSYTDVPEYETDDSPIGYSLSGLHKEYSRLPYFFNTPNYIQNDHSRNRKLRNIFEIIHWTETPILEALILKKELPNINKELAKKAFPELFQESE
jgi:hypothetical protein